MNIQTVGENMQGGNTFGILLNFLNAQSERRGHPVCRLFQVVLEALRFQLAILLEELNAEPRERGAKQAHGCEKDGQRPRPEPWRGAHK